MVFLDRENCSKAEQVLIPGGKMQIRQGEDIPLDREHLFLNLLFMLNLFLTLLYLNLLLMLNLNSHAGAFKLSNCSLVGQKELDWYKLTPEKRKPELLIKFASVSQAKRIFPNKSNVGNLNIFKVFSQIFNLYPCRSVNCRYKVA